MDNFQVKSPEPWSDATLHNFVFNLGRLLVIIILYSK